MCNPLRWCDGLWVACRESRAGGAYFYFHWASRIFVLHFKERKKDTQNPPPSLKIHLKHFSLSLFAVSSLPNFGRAYLRASVIGPCDAPAVSQLASGVVEDLSRCPQWHGAALQTHHHKK